MPTTTLKLPAVEAKPGATLMLTTKTLLGAGWTVSARLAGRLVDFVTILVLARILTPADFGLTAIATTLVSVVDTVLEVPVILALISLRRVTKPHMDTAFTLGLLRGLLLTVVVLSAAWPFSRIYHDDRLISLVAVLAIGPMARSLYSPSMVKYAREMSFRQGFAADVMGKLASSAIAVSVVFLGGGYWAIAAGSVSGSVATTLISYVLAGYRPALSLSRFSEFSTFLGWFSTAQILAALSWQYDRIFLGYFISKADLGQYTMASDLSVLPTQSMIGPAMQPLVAAFSRINDDRERVRSAYLKASNFTMMLAAPTSIGMSLTSDLIVGALLGAKWSEAAVYLQWLALSVVLSAFYQPLHSLTIATNRTKLVFRLSFIELSSRVILVPVGYYFFSVMGVITARVAVSLIMFVLTLLTARQLIGVRVAAVLGSLWKVGAACAAMALSVLMLRYELAGRNLNTFAELGLTAGFGAAIYVGMLLSLGVRVRGYLQAIG
jgi:O-antigen/teichoic acid export membrane protein